MKNQMTKSFSVYFILTFFSYFVVSKPVLQDHLEKGSTGAESKSKTPQKRNVDQEESTSMRRSSLKRFQGFYGLEPTGIMDKKTRRMMSSFKCGTSGINETKSDVTKNRRVKRYKVHEGGPWKKLQLTYRVANMPPKVRRVIARAGYNRLSKKAKDLTKIEVKEAIDRAFERWQSISKLTFKRVKRNPDILLTFTKQKHKLNDGSDRDHDGPGNFVAHSSWPSTGGYIHYDNSEMWTLDTGVGADLFQVTVHEIGHALGLAHTDVRRAVMYKKVRYKNKWRFHTDDIYGIWFLYGAPDDD